MGLKTQIDADIKAAMLAKEKDKLTALRSIKSMILLEETKEGAVAELSTDDEIRLLTKAAKQRRDSLEVFTNQNRPDLAEKEAAELAVIEVYLPKQLDAEQLRAALQAIVSELGATGPADLGKVMGVATKRLAGQAEGKAVSAAVKEMLSGTL
jgi:uncharacterized protein